MRGGFRSAMELAVARRLRLDPQRITAHCGLHIVKLNRQGRIEPGSDGYFFHETRFLSRFDIRSAGHALKPVCCVNVEPHATVSYFLLASPAGDKAGPPGDPQGGGEVVAKGIEPLCSRRQGSCRARSIARRPGQRPGPTDSGDAVSDRVYKARFGYLATHSTSSFAPSARPLQPKAERAGRRSGLK